jgi:PAS domain S-box-containing protein
MASIPTAAAAASTPAANVEILHAAVEAFRRREVNYRDILEDLPAAIYTTDADGRITYFNQACVAFSGRTPTLGDDHWCVSWKLYTSDGEPLAHDQCPMAIALKEQRPVRGVEAQAERPDGTRIAFQPFPTPIFDAAGTMVGAVNMLVDISEQKKTQERLTLMAREVDHRANNLLGVMQGLLHITKGETVDEYRDALRGRFEALSRANSLISERRWTSVDLRALVEEEMGAYRGQVRIEGDAIEISPPSAQCLGMMIHELATNAVKYGALSRDTGHVAIDWSVDDGGALMLRWEESGGPELHEPTRKGTGSSVIAGAVRQLGGEIFREWRPAGLRCTFLCQAAEL